MLHSSIVPKLFGADPNYFLGGPNLFGTEFSCDNSKLFGTDTKYLVLDQIFLEPLEHLF